MLHRILNSRWFERRRVDAWLPWVFLFAALPITFLIWQHEKYLAYTEQKIRFESHAKETEGLIQRHLLEYQHMLDGVQSFYRASSFVSQEEFNDYVSALLQPNRFSDLRSLAFAKYVDETSPASYVGLAEDWQSLAKRMTPYTASDAYAPIIYAAPNSSLLLAPHKTGTLLDALGEPAIRQTLLKSADLNTVIASPVMQSIQGSQVNDCFLMQLPIYQNATFNNNLTQRRAHIYGWILATINSELFFTEAIKSVENGLLSYQLYDITSNQYDKPIYETKNRRYEVQSTAPMFVKRYIIKAIGYEWNMRAASLPDFEESLDYKRANYIGLLGLFISFALSGILYLLVVRTRAVDTIYKVSNQLSASEQRWQLEMDTRPRHGREPGC